MREIGADEGTTGSGAVIEDDPNAFVVIDLGHQVNGGAYGNTLRRERLPSRDE